MLRASIILAAIPVLVFAIMGTGKSKAPIPPKPVQTEGVRKIDMDTQTFNARWRPVNDIPPAIEVRYARERVAGEVSGAAVSPPAVQPPRHRLRTKTVKLDICQKHNMHRVMVSKYRWRCRR